MQRQETIRDDRPGRLPPHRARAVREAGRILAVALPVASLVALAAAGDPADRALGAGVQALVWVVFVRLGRTLDGASLTALGPRVATARGVLLGLLASSAVDEWLHVQHLSPQTTIGLALVVFGSVAWWETFALRHVTPAMRLLLVGQSRGALALLDDIRAGRGGGYEAIGVVADGAADESAVNGVPRLGRLRDLAAVIEEHRPDLVVLAPGARRSRTFVQVLDAAGTGFRVVELADFYEYAYGRVPVEDLPHAWFMSVLHLYRRPYTRLTKRLVDVVGALALLALTLPLFPVLALFVRRTEGPVILRQVRLGEHGRLFTILKFRTMRADAEAPGQAVWSTEGDPRLTRVGGIMRRLRLDELPQLWNVLRGEMSLVGPRPERPEFMEELSARVPHWTRRHLVKPGLTGWAQVRQGYTASAEDTSLKLSYDLWYIRRCSLTVDLAVLLRTVAVVLRGTGAAARPAAALVRAPAVGAPVFEPSD